MKNTTTKYVSISMSTMVANAKAHGYTPEMKSYINSSGKKKEKVRVWLCVHCYPTQWKLIASNPKCNIEHLERNAANASRNIARFNKKGKPSILKCCKCGWYKKEGGVEHIPGQKIPVPQVKPTPTVTSVYKDGVIPPEAKKVKMCGRCGKHPIPYGRKKLCYVCCPPSKARV